MGDSLPGSEGVYCHKALLNIFCKQNSGFKICHFNARSLNCSKLDYVRYVFEQSSVDILCVSETWFDSAVPNSVYEIPGFVLFRRDRTAKRGGGVGIYCRKELKARFVDYSINSVIEYISVEISNADYKILVSCVYNPHRDNSLDEYFSTLSPILIAYDFYVIAGDFNINLLRNDSAFNAFSDLYTSSGLAIVNSTVPTRFSHDTLPSLLDLFLVSDVSSVLKFEQCSFISDHDLIFCCLDIPIACSFTPFVYSYRDYRNINYANLFNDLSKVRWSDCWSYDTVDNKLYWFMSIISKIFDCHVLVKTKSSTANSCPWFSTSVHNAIKLRNIQHSKWRKCPNNCNWLSYVKSRNDANSIIKHAKQVHYSSLLNKSLPPKQLWKNLRKLRITKTQSLECDLLPDELNAHFSSTTMPNKNPQNFEFSYCKVNQEFDFCTVSEDEVARQIYSITSDAMGYDGMPVAFVKIILPHILSTLTHIINHCFTTSAFPALWKVATITPIAKKANATDITDFRPISIIPALAKVFERIIYEQITDHINGSKLLSYNQSGFRRSHSCTTAMLKILDDIRIENDKNNITLLGLLDFSKAFDTVMHDKLCSKLNYYFHFSRHATDLIKSYLSNRLQRVKVCNKFSSFAEVSIGIPQGSILGPLLFCLFINDLFRTCEYASMHGYADDIQLYVSGPPENFNELVTKMNLDLNLINCWANENGLIINTNKSMIIPISRRELGNGVVIEVKIGSDTLNVCHTVRNLGYVINSKLSGSDHINYIVGKIYCILRTLRRTACYTPLDIRRNLIKQLILPYIIYAAPVLGKLDFISRRKLIVAFNCATRYVYGLKKFDHISAFSSGILGVKIEEYWDIRNLIYLHNLVINKCPGYLYDKLTFGNSKRSAHLLVPNFPYLNTSRLFFVHAVRLWNTLPITIRKITGRHAFIKSLYMYYSYRSLS